MILALAQMDATVQGIFFLVAVVVFVIAAFLARPALWSCLVAAGLAFATFVFMWNAFAAKLMAGSIEIRDVDTDELYFRGDIVNREGKWDGGLGVIVVRHGEDPTVLITIESL